MVSSSWSIAIIIVILETEYEIGFIVDFGMLLKSLFNPSLFFWIGRRPFPYVGCDMK